MPTALPHPPSFSPRRSAPLCAAAALLSCISGCTLLGIAGEAINGPKPTPARYVLPDRVTAVLVDTTDPNLSDPRLPRTVGAVALHHMRFHGAPRAAALVDAAQVARLEARLDSGWATTPIDAIGRQLQADQVVYAQLHTTGLEAHRGDLNGVPALRLDVKVIDSHTGDRLWPPPSAAATNGHPLIVRANAAQRHRLLTGSASTQAMLQQLADAAGLALAQLFYDWTPPPPGRELDR